MDYGQLLYKAQENKRNAASKDVRCYTTSFQAPKKIERSKVSSENIKKFLARKEEEEKKKLMDAKKKKDELLALRSQDKKAQKRVQVMLKRTKSANKSVMEDAIDNVNTADTLAGPAQCDEDDYGYVSHEASAFYNKLIDKYQNMPVEKSLFSKGKREVKDLNAAKDRVKAALQKEAEEELFPLKRKRKKKDKEDQGEDPEKDSVDQEEKEIKKGLSLDEKSKQNEPVKKKLARSMPPPVDFEQLLKIAEKKQFEPIVIDKVKEAEEERLMTKKEKIEYMKEKERKFRKASGKSIFSTEKIGLTSEKPLVSEKYKSGKDKLANIGKINKNCHDEIINQVECNHIESKRIIPSNDKVTKKNDRSSEPTQLDERLKKSACVWAKPCNLPNKSEKKSLIKKCVSPSIDKDKKINPDRKKLCTYSMETTAEKNPTNIDELSEIDREIELLRRKRELLASRSTTNEKKDVKPLINNNTFQPKILKDPKPRPVVNSKKLKSNKRRVNSDSEYDSELDDFIDDGPEEEDEDYSKHIREIFGYDRSRFMRDEDDECMESNFAQQMEEEYVSTKIGIMEDLEDIRKEQEEKARKKMKKTSRS